MKGHILKFGYVHGDFSGMVSHQIFGTGMLYCAKSVWTCSSLGFGAGCCWSKSALNVSDSGCAWALKKFFKVKLSLIYFRGSIPASVHRLAMGDDLKAPVHALKHSFWIGFRRCKTCGLAVP